MTKDKNEIAELKMRVSRLERRLAERPDPNLYSRMNGIVESLNAINLDDKSNDFGVAVRIAKKALSRVMVYF